MPRYLAISETETKPRRKRRLVPVWQFKGGKAALSWNEVGPQGPHGDSGTADSNEQPTSSCLGVGGAPAS